MKKDSEYLALLAKEHTAKQHVYRHAKKVINLLHFVLDSAKGEPLTASQALTKMGCGLHPDCPLCQANLRRSWRAWTKYNRSLVFDYVQPLKGMSHSTARYFRIESNVYQAKR